MLREGGRLTRRDIEERILASRRTVTRTLDELENRGWVRSQSNDYELTALGGTVLRDFERFTANLELADEFSELLERIPADEFDLSAACFEGAELVVATDSDPYAPMERIHARRFHADSVREVTPFFCVNGAEKLAELVTSSDPVPDIKLVFGPDTANAAETDPKMAANLDTVLGAEGVSFRLHSGPIPFLCGRYDDTALVCAMNDDLMPAVVAETTAEPVLDWVTDEFETYWEQSSEFELVARTRGK